LLNKISGIQRSAYACAADHIFNSIRQLSISQRRVMDAHQQLSHELPPEAHARQRSPLESLSQTINTIM